MSGMIVGFGKAVTVGVPTTRGSEAAIEDGAWAILRVGTTY